MSVGRRGDYDTTSINMRRHVPVDQFDLFKGISTRLLMTLMDGFSTKREACLLLFHLVFFPFN